MKTSLFGADIIPLSEYERTEFHNDFGKPCGLSGGVSAVIRADASVAAVLSASQRPHGRRFDHNDVLLLRRLLPHLQRAFQVHERLSEVAQARASAEDVIDRMLPCPRRPLRGLPVGSVTRRKWLPVMWGIP